MNNFRKQLRLLVIDALMIALYVVLNVITEIPIGTVKITFGPLPIIILVFYFAYNHGITHGAIVAVIGEFLAQWLSYGLDYLILLWAVPPVARVLVAGLILKLIIKVKKTQNITKISYLEYFIIILISGFVTTCLNTAVMGLHAFSFGYYSHNYVFGTLIIRFVTMVISSVIYTIAAKTVTDTLYKAKI